MQWLMLMVLTVTAHFSFPVSYLTSHFFVLCSWFYQFLQNYSSVVYLVHILVDEYESLGQA